MIELRNVNFSYPGAPKVLCDISTEIGPGIYLLMGENGSGKSTLLHLIAGLRFPTSGSCRCDGIETRLRRPRTLRKLQYLDAGMRFPCGNMADMIRLHAPLFPNFSSAILEENLRLFGLSLANRFADMTADTFMKAKLAYMLSLRCDILLLDDPMNGLDADSRSKFRTMLINCVAENQTVVIATNQINEFLPLYDNLMILLDGGLPVNVSSADLSEKLIFTTSAFPTPGAIYSRQQQGVYQNILSNDRGTDVSEPNPALLYDSLNSTGRAEILKALNNS